MQKNGVCCCPVFTATRAAAATGSLGITTATTAAVLSQAPPVVAQDSSAVARIAKAITVRIEGATKGSGVLVKKSRKVSYNSTY